MKSNPSHKIKTRPTINVIEFFSGSLFCCVSIKTVNNQTLSMFIFIVDFTTVTTFCLYRLLHEMFYSKQSFFIDLEQTGTPRVPYSVKHVDKF